MNVQALFPNVGCMSEEARSFDPVLGKMQLVVRPLVAFIKPEVQQIYSEVVEEG